MTPAMIAHILKTYWHISSTFANPLASRTSGRAEWLCNAFG
jgi:hypothetical protein